MKTNWRGIGFVLAVLAGGMAVCASADVIGVNLLTNSTASSSNMNGWTVTANGGSGWAVNKGVFSTSYNWDIRSQTVDLLAKGLTASQLDASPTIDAGVWENTYWGGKYFLNVSLQDASHNVITNYNLGSQSSPIVVASTLDTNYYWIGTTFDSYASGVRYVTYTDGGMDTRGWAGNYGTSFQLAEVTVIPEPGVAGMILLTFFVAWYFRKWRRLFRSAQPAKT